MQCRLQCGTDKLFKKKNYRRYFEPMTKIGFYDRLGKILILKKTYYYRRWTYTVLQVRKVIRGVGRILLFWTFFCIRLLRQFLILIISTLLLSPHSCLTTCFFIRLFSWLLSKERKLVKKVHLLFWREILLPHPHRVGSEIPTNLSGFELEPALVFQ